MSVWQDRRVILGVGTAAVLLAGVLIALFLMRGPKPSALPVGQHGSLLVEVGRSDAKVDPAKPLRCFVGGQFVGEMTLAACAQRNGVAAQKLDVGLDPATGQVAASNAGATPLQPIAPAPAAAPPALRPAPDAPPLAAASGSTVTGDCLQYGPDGWRPMGGPMSLGQCVRALYDGRCVRAGDAAYGRWASQTLRAVPGRVEVSSDNRSFNLLREQNPDCSLPAG